MARQGKLTYRGPERLREIERTMSDRVETAAEHVAGEARRNVSTTYNSAGPSDVGEYPHLRSGQLRRSIIAEKADAKGLTWRIGSDQRYGLYLEFGGRSFLRRTLLEQESAVRRILSRPLKLGA